MAVPLAYTLMRLSPYSLYAYSQVYLYALSFQIPINF